jgi:preprotein translocase subunit Sss1
MHSRQDYMVTRDEAFGFAKVGVIGFVIHGFILTHLINFLGWGHYSARAVGT